MNLEKKYSFIVNVIFYIIISAIAFLLIKYALPILAPFVFGLLIAYVLRKPTKYLSQRFKLDYKPVALLMVLLFYATIGFLVFLLGIKAVSSIQSIIAFITAFYETGMTPILLRAFDSIENTLVQIDPSTVKLVTSFSDQIMQSLGNMISGLSSWAVSTVSSLATSIPVLFIKLVLMVISSAFIAVDFDLLFDFCRRQLSPKASALFEQIRDYVIGTLFVCIRSYFIIMSVTFTELSIGLTLIGLDYSILIALCIAVFDILPVLGTGGIMLPWVVITLLSGDFTRALALFLLYLIITVVRNIIEPKIVGGQLGLHPIVTLVSMFLGVNIFGVIGLFGFPIMLSLLRHLNDNGTIHIFK